MEYNCVQLLCFCFDFWLHLWAKISSIMLCMLVFPTADFWFWVYGLKCAFLHKAQLHPGMVNLKKKGHFPSKRCFLWATDKSLGVFISKCISCQHLSVSAKTTHWNKFLGHIYVFTAQDQGLELRDSGTEMFSPVDVAHTARPWMLHLMSTSRLTGFGTRVCPLTVLGVKG